MDSCFCIGDISDVRVTAHGALANELREGADDLCCPKSCWVEVWDERFRTAGIQPASKVL